MPATLAGPCVRAKGPVAPPSQAPTAGARYTGGPGHGESGARRDVQGEHETYVGGNRVNYDPNFTCATVRGAGHMGPATRAEAALELVKRGVLGKGF